MKPKLMITLLAVLFSASSALAGPVTGATCIATDGFSHADLVERPAGTYSTRNREFEYNLYKLKLKTTRIPGEVLMTSYLKGEEGPGDELAQEIQTGQKIYLNDSNSSFECTLKN